MWWHSLFKDSNLMKGKRRSHVHKHFFLPNSTLLSLPFLHFQFLSRITANSFLTHALQLILAPLLSQEPYFFLTTPFVEFGDTNSFAHISFKNKDIMVAVKVHSCFSFFLSFSFSSLFRYIFPFSCMCNRSNVDSFSMFLSI